MARTRSPHRGGDPSRARLPQLPRPLSQRARRSSFPLPRLFVWRDTWRMDILLRGLRRSALWQMCCRQRGSYFGRGGGRSLWADSLAIARRPTGNAARAYLTLPGGAWCAGRHRRACAWGAGEFVGGPAADSASDREAEVELSLLPELRHRWSCAGPDATRRLCPRGQAHG